VKFQISNSKSQINLPAKRDPAENKILVRDNNQNSNGQNKNLFWSFGHWSLNIIWNLELGVWNF